MKITALAGGVGASKFLAGLTGIVPPENITIIANTGDDIELCGLRISPDIDTIIYTLGGVINQETGWGLAGDTFECLGRLEGFGQPSWFKLGDRDLATHIYRTYLLRLGRSLSEITDLLRKAHHVRSRILPMTDAYTPTQVKTNRGELHFQEYFVRLRCEPRVESIRFENIEGARPAPGVEEAILEADCIIICPSNPFISIGPILAVPGIRESIIKSTAIVVGVTPIIGGKALKGPAADMLRDLGYEVSAAGVAGIYRDFADVFVLDRQDAELGPAVEKLGLRAAITDTIMNSSEDKQRLARAIIDAASPP